MTAATFGELARQAEEQLAAALACPPDQADPVAVARQLRHVIGRMARYLDDQVPGYAVEGVSTVGMAPWQRAAVDARTALRWAASCLPGGGRTASAAQAGPQVLATCLSKAARSMMTGRDLLHTHVMLGPDGWPGGRSAWAAAVTSAPVTRALTSQVARWSGQVALIAARQAVCPASSRTPGELVDGLQRAAQWLWLAQAAVRPAQAAESVSKNDRRLLGAIPAARDLRRVPPDGPEQAGALCAGIAVSAERLRGTVLVTAERQRWAPVSADAWRWTATAAAITGQASEHLLRSLVGQPAIAPRHPGQLEQAVEAVRQATLAWRRVADRWLGLATETRGHAFPVVIEAGDLVLRMGRLAWNDPHWAPARQPPPPQPPRPARPLAPGRSLPRCIRLLMPWPRWPPPTLQR